ncbi:hypothetical protein [Variovorax sp. Root473]|uniref:hypothetical protein n=1 Tax=Variovorax sp. Root473 TaxID=1736541 RepID=UPI00138F31F3|nr:hypothetical protein [Variovorax sp. Root473]
MAIVTMTSIKVNPFCARRDSGAPVLDPVGNATRWFIKTAFQANSSPLIKPKKQLRNIVKLCV